jgi:hypothetical protein
MTDLFESPARATWFDPLKSRRRLRWLQQIDQRARRRLDHVQPDGPPSLLAGHILRIPRGFHL